MDISEAQREMHAAFLGGFAGQLVSGLIWLFGGLAALLVLTGTGLAMYCPAAFSTGGWLTGATLIAFAFAGRAVVMREENRSRDRV